VFKKVSVVGLGLIGGSMAAGMRKRGIVERISAFDASPEALQNGLERHVIDEKADSIEACVLESDLVVLAVPVLSIRETLVSLKAVFEDGSSIVTDVGSVKSPIIETAEDLFGELPKNLVPGHPIAGSEKHGVNAANPDLFEGHKVILTPTNSVSEQAINTITALWQDLGANVIQMTAGHHDGIFAQTSHLPHLLAYALVDMLSAQGDSLEIFQYAAGGFRDFSRIAASDPVMWRDIFRANQDEVLDSLDKYLSELGNIRKMIAEGNMQELEELFKRAKVARDHFSGLSSGLKE
jgi:cyclohexadieny/prephenate dehydrogenase / 3-phosphoshikimate 1-carboxyvinyltransferase